MILHANNIPFRYECALYFGNNTLYPDFTIRHPETDETVYWEHFGMMGKEEYSKNAFSKLHLYNSNGILLNKQLIATFESPEYPLQPDEIEKIIKDWFL